MSLGPLDEQCSRHSVHGTGSQWGTTNVPKRSAFPTVNPVSGGVLKDPVFELLDLTRALEMRLKLRKIIDSAGRVSHGNMVMRDGFGLLTVS